MTATAGAEPRVEEMEGTALDLGRPELGVLMERYAPSTPPRRITMFNPPTVVIVPRRTGEEAPLQEALEKDGWFVKTCPGPGAGNCPVMSGTTCDLRKSVDAAVVFVDPDAPALGIGMVNRLVCAGDSASPGVVAIERSCDAPRFGGGSATVGALRGPKGIITALTGVLELPS